MWKLSSGLTPFGPDANCAPNLCSVEDSIYQYRPSLAASGVFIALFSCRLLTLLFGTYRSAQETRRGLYRRSFRFLCCIAVGCMFEVAGYAVRIVLYKDPFNFTAFMVQIVCITIAPVFFTSAAHLHFSQVMRFFDNDFTHYNRKIFHWVFLPCDFISLLVQLTGVAFSSSSKTIEGVEIGRKITFVGLIFQIATFLVSTALYADYLFSYRSKDVAPKSKWQVSMAFSLVPMFTAIALLLARCAFRAYQFREGYFSETFRNEATFIALESVFTYLGALLLNFGHPVSFKQHYKDCAGYFACFIYMVTG